MVHPILSDSDIMTRIDEDVRPSTTPAENSAITYVIAFLRRICVRCADIMVPDTQSVTRSVSLLGL